MTYKFQGSLYRTAREMHDAIASEWLSAGGLNSAEDQSAILADETAEAMADEATRWWNLLGVDCGGNRVMPEFDRSALIAAFRRMQGA